MTHLAGIFPGQGSQSLGMLAELAQTYPVVIDTFAESSAILGYDLWALVQHGPIEQLNLTQYTQSAMLAAGVACYRVLLSTVAWRPHWVAGHSLGEYSALVAADVLSFADAVALVAERGRLMAETIPQGQGAMAAIIGMDNEEVVALCEQAAGEQTLSPANYNAIGQTVIAGDTAAVQRAIVLATEKGARMAKLIPVSAPCHCDLLKPAAEEFKRYLQNTAFHSPSIPLINNVDVALLQHADDIRHALYRQLYSPVRWVETIEFMAQQEVDTVVESGPGKVLMGLVKRIARDMRRFAVYDRATLQEVQDHAIAK